MPLNHPTVHDTRIGLPFRNNIGQYRHKWFWLGDRQVKGVTTLKDKPNLLLVLWLVTGGILAAFAMALLLNSHRFDWALQVKQMPAVQLGLGLAAAGAVYLFVLPLVRMSICQPAAIQQRFLWLIVIVGLGLRLMMFLSAPAMEDDYNRYLWEGALVAHGISPYAVSPQNGREAKPGTRLGSIAKQSGAVVYRVNHPSLKTTYPPVAQAAFALAHVIAPWNFAVWRAMSLISDLAIAAMLIVHLKHSGRSSLWAVLYWWNPLVIKELINSGHMESILMALVLAALLLSAQRRHFWALLALGFAIGTKLWPVLLAPLLLRPLWPRPVLFVSGFGLLCIMSVIWALPGYFGGLDQSSGFVAYAQHWKTNSALFPLLDHAFANLLSLGRMEQHSWAFTRTTIGVSLFCLAAWQAWNPLKDTADLMRRACFITAALVLLSPAQYPWYMVWMLPFVVFLPNWGLLATTVTVPLYYVSFYFLARGNYDVFSDYIVWMIWLPVWTLLALSVCYYRQDHHNEAIS